MKAQIFNTIIISALGRTITYLGDPGGGNEIKSRPLSPHILPGHAGRIVTSVLRKDVSATEI